MVSGWVGYRASYLAYVVVARTDGGCAAALSGGVGLEVGAVLIRHGAAPNVNWKKRLSMHIVCMTICMCRDTLEYKDWKALFKTIIF